MGSSWLCVAAVDKRREALDEFFRLFPMREVSGRGDHFELGPGNLLAPTLAVGRGNDAVLRSPQQQGRRVNAVQPVLQSWVVHVGLPAVKREGFPAAHDCLQ